MVSVHVSRAAASQAVVKTYGCRYPSRHSAREDAVPVQEIRNGPGNKEWCFPLFDYVAELLCKGCNPAPDCRNVGIGGADIGTEAFPRGLPYKAQATALPDRLMDKRVAVNGFDYGHKIEIEGEIVPDKRIAFAGKGERPPFLPGTGTPVLPRHGPIPSGPRSQRKTCPHESVWSREKGRSWPSVIRGMESMSLSDICF